tara:strand:- start:151 stop:282 length:132 start_codon:yes stop_codon:yes gene_type:complete
MNHIEELDRLAEETYGEFGFITCSEFERARIATIYYNQLKSIK